MKYDIKTIEGALHIITITVNDGVDFTNYSVYGSCGGGCCCKHFIIEDQTNTKCKVVIPALSRGVYDYQLFAKQNDTNKEFLIISGQIIAEDRICDNANNSIDYKTTVADVTISADTVEVSVTIEGEKGDDGGYYIPSVSAEGDLSWTATESDMPTVATVNIRGPQGEQGPAGEIDTSILEDYATIAYVDEAVEGAGGGGTSYSSFWADYYIALGMGYTTKYKSTPGLLMLNLTNPQWRKDLTENGEWNYSFDSLNQNNPNFSHWYSDYDRNYGTLRAFNSYMPSVTSLNNSFQYCQELESWICGTPQCTNMEGTFRGCTKLKYFRGDLSNLQSAQNMFGSSSGDCTQLDLASVQHIANVINPNGNWNTIHIGVSNTLNGSSELEEALQQIRDKSWYVEVLYSDNG